PGFAPVFRMSGFNFGRVDSNITLVKVTDALGESGYDYQEHESPVTRVRLDREVIVVPVNVVVEAPYPGRPFSGEYARSVMELIAGSPRSFPALFDDERIGAVSGGGGATTE